MCEQRCGCHLLAVKCMKTHDADEIIEYFSSVQLCALNIFYVCEYKTSI